jgi:hypothetical protein
MVAAGAASFVRFLRVNRSVRFDVVLGSVFCVLLGVDVVAMGEVSMVGGRFVISVEVMFRGFAVMARSVLVVLRCLGVMPSCFVRHGIPLVVPQCARHGRIIESGGCRSG